MTETAAKLLEEHREAIDEAHRGITSEATRKALLALAESMGAVMLPRVQVQFSNDELAEAVIIREGRARHMQAGNREMTLRFTSNGFDKETEFDFEFIEEEGFWFSMDGKETAVSMTRIGNLPQVDPRKSNIGDSNAAQSERYRKAGGREF